MSELFAAFGVNWKLLLVQALNFGFLLAALWYFLYGPVLKLIDDRRKSIAEGVRQAEAAARRLAEAKAEGDVIVGEAAREAEQLMGDARARAQDRAGEIIKAAEERAAASLREAAERGEEAQRRALQESEREIARVAMLAAEKILREKSA